MSQSPAQRTHQRELNQRLCRAVQESGLTGVEIARRVGIEAPSVSRWLTRGAVPSAGVLHKLPYVLGVSSDWLLAHRGPMRSGAPQPVSAPHPEYQAGAVQALADAQKALAALRSAWEKGGPTLGADETALRAAQVGERGLRPPRSHRQTRG